jgi:hypothetical protein
VSYTQKQQSLGHMDEQRFNFDAPVPTPFARGSHSSWTGAVSAQPRATSQAGRLLALYREHGPQSDQQAAAALCLPLASICARRAVLVQRSQVEFKDYIAGVAGAKQSRWGIR